jgi:predicted amidophosphoribosyltransferase
LIRAARAGDRAAASEVIDRVRVVAWTVWPEIESAVVVAVPGHRTGPANQLNLEVASELALIRHWNHAPGTLRRWSPVQEAKAGGPRDVTTEAMTMAWVSAGDDEAIILVDDVVRTGLTLRSCATSIRAAGDQRRIVGLCLAARASD